MNSFLGSEKMGPIQNYPNNIEDQNVNSIFNSSNLMSGGLESNPTNEQKIRMLGHWANTLNNLSRENKMNVLDASKIPSLDKFVEGFGIENYINEWSSNIELYKITINNIFNSIIRLFELGVIRNDYFNPYYVSQYLRDMESQEVQRKPSIRDNISDIKKVMSAPNIQFGNHYQNQKKTDGL